MRNKNAIYLFFANIYSIITVNPLWNLCIYNKRWKRQKGRTLWREKEVIVSHAGRNLCCVHAGRLRIGGTSRGATETTGAVHRRRTGRNGTVKLRECGQRNQRMMRWIRWSTVSKKSIMGRQLFDITLWNRMRIPIRDNVLGDVHNLPSWPTVYHLQMTR